MRSIAGATRASLRGARRVDLLSGTPSEANPATRSLPRAGRTPPLDKFRTGSRSRCGRGGHDGDHRGCGSVSGEGRMTEKRIAIACQGGGSQCAFVAGALKALFARRIQDRYRIVALSGTSGGAFTAALAWQGLLLEARGDRTPVEDRIIACWRDLTAQTRVEIAVDAASVQLMRQVQSGLLPSIARSPSSVQFRLWAAAVSRLVARPEFTDLRALLRSE